MDNSLGIVTGLRWEVFSDRSGNNTYTDSGGKTIKFKAGFLESFYVTNEINDYLHVFSDPSPENSGILSNNAVDKGWIKKSNVILWRNCIISGSSKLQLQVMTHGSPELFDTDIPDSLTQGGVDVYTDPLMRVKGDGKTRIRRVYFVYKKQGNAILLGEKKRIPFNSSVSKVIIGWVPEEYCYFLNTRIWISANKNEEAVKEMAMKRIIPSLFIEESQANAFVKTMESESRYILWQQIPDQNNKQWTCFPLISKTDEVFKVSIVENNFETGYAPVHPAGMENPIFSEVTLISNDELSNVVSNISKFVLAAGDDFDRQEILKCLITLYKNEYNGLNDDYIKNLSIREIFDGLFWLSNSSDAYLNSAARKILDPTVIGDDKITGLLNKMKVSVIEMKKIINESHQVKGSVFISNGMRYYWIDLALFF